MIVPPEFIVGCILLQAGVISTANTVSLRDLRIPDAVGLDNIDRAGAWTDHFTGKTVRAFLSGKFGKVPEVGRLCQRRCFHGEKRLKPGHTAELSEIREDRHSTAPHRQYTGRR